MVTRDSTWKCGEGRDQVTGSYSCSEHHLLNKLMVRDVEDGTMNQGFIRSTTLIVTGLRNVGW